MEVGETHIYGKLISLGLFKFHKSVHSSTLTIFVHSLQISFFPLLSDVESSWPTAIPSSREQRYRVNPSSRSTHPQSCELSVLYEVNCFIGAKLTKVSFEKH